MLKHFWCEDVATAAKACLENCPQDTQRSISIAEDVCQHRFVFRDHWEMERTNQPVDFGQQVTDIQWDCIPAGDPEWLYAMNRHTCFVNLGKAWQYTKEKKYARKYAELIEDWIDRVPLTPQSEGDTWRSLEAGLRCEYWLRALKLFEDSPVVTPALREKIHQTLLVHGEYLTRKYNHFHELSNWGTLQDHGLFLLGVYFSKEEWIQLALKRLDLNIHRSVMADGSQWEQSPMYHCEVLHAAIDTLQIARQNAISVPRRFEQNILQMCQALTAWVTPDGRLLCQSDSDDTNARDILVQGALLFEDCQLKTAAGKDFLEENYWDFGPEKLQQYQEIAGCAEGMASSALVDSGNYLLRSNFTEDSGYLHFHCGCMGSGHGHADQLHIDAGIGGEDVLIDSGRYTYVDNAVRKQLKEPAAHNTTRVDNQNFTICADTWAYTKMAVPMKGQHSFTVMADAVEGAHLGYLDQGVLASRKVVYLKEWNVALICDRFDTQNNDTHQYEANFHFGEGQTTLSGHTVHWKGKRAEAVLMALDHNTTQTLHKAPYSRDYNDLQEGDVLTTSTQQDGFSTMLHLLSMDCDGKEHTIIAEKIPVSKIISGEQLTEQQAQAVRIQKDGKEVVILLCHQELISAVDMLQAGEYYGYGKTLVFTSELPEGQCLSW